MGTDRLAIAPESLAPRSLRALTLAGASVSVGLAAHTHSAAAMPNAWSLVAVAGVLAISWVATARQVSWALIAMILAVGQALTHISASAGLPATVSSANPGHHGELMVIGGPATSLDTTMLSGHIVAWLVLTLAFTIGERALWRTVARLITGWSRPTVLGHRPGLALGDQWSPWGALTPSVLQDRAPPAS